jgi:DNA-binding response OmpR family regulator
VESNLKVQTFDVVKVLIVDDEPSVTFYIADFLKSHRMETFVARDGTAALALVGGGAEYDVAILDRRLPDGDGLALLGGLRKAGLACPVLVLTGFAELDHAREAGRLGVASYLEKPVAGPRLVAAIRRALSVSEQTVTGVLGRIRCEDLVRESIALWAEDRAGRQASGVMQRAARAIVDPDIGIREFVVAAACLRAAVSRLGPVPSAIRPVTFWGTAAVLLTPIDPRVLLVVTAIERSGVDWLRLSASVVARQLNVSEPTLWRLLHAALRLSFTELRRSVVIRAGLRSLADGPEHVRQVAFQQGYASHSQFVRDVRRVTGVSPTRLRLMVGNTNEWPEQARAQG